MGSPRGRPASERRHMSRPVWYCHNTHCKGSHKVERKTAQFCPDCGQLLNDIPLSKEEKAMFAKTSAESTKPDPTPEPETEEESMENKKSNYRWLWILLVILAIIIGAVLIIRMVSSYQNRISRLEVVAMSANNQTVPVYVAPAASGPNTVPSIPGSPQTNYDNFITVYRGDTDKETILFNDSWPGFYANQNINWIDKNGLSNIHLLGGTYVVPSDGIISGDVKVNGVAIYDNNEKTFLVIRVQKGDQVFVNPNWKAWYTNQYSEESIVKAVETQFPSWSRQPSPLN